MQFRYFFHIIEQFTNHQSLITNSLTKFIFKIYFLLTKFSIFLSLKKLDLPSSPFSSKNRTPNIWSRSMTNSRFENFGRERVCVFLVSYNTSPTWGDCRFNFSLKKKKKNWFGGGNPNGVYFWTGLAKFRIKTTLT